jgi:hypothetical protein
LILEISLSHRLLCHLYYELGSRWGYQ